MSYRTVAVIGLAALTGLAALSSAQAQTRHPRRLHVVVAPVTAPPLTVRKRSFLDPGPVVQVGAEHDYFVENSSFATPIYATYAPARSGESTLPGRFDLPNNPRFQP